MKQPTEIQEFAKRIQDQHGVKINYGKTRTIAGYLRKIGYSSLADMIEPKFKH